jgi:hypothetical protein
LWIDHNVRPAIACPEAQIGLNLSIDGAGSELIGDFTHELFGATELAIHVLTYKANGFH